VAWHLGGFHSLVYAEIGKRTAAGQSADDIASAMLELLDVFEDLLGERLLTYAIRKD
jgi:hypothetical protein